MMLPLAIARLDQVRKVGGQGLDTTIARPNDCIRQPFCVNISDEILRISGTAGTHQFSNNKTRTRESSPVAWQNEVLHRSGNQINHATDENACSPTSRVPPVGYKSVIGSLPSREPVAVLNFEAIVGAGVGEMTKRSLTTRPP